MEYSWFLSYFESQERSVVLECDLHGDDIDNITSDFTKLSSMAFKNNCRSGDIDTGDGDEISCKFTFADESGWKTFCEEFLALIQDKD